MYECMHVFTMQNVTCGYLCRYGNTSPHRLRRNTVLTLGMKGKEEKATNTYNRAASKRLSNVLKRCSAPTRGAFHCQAALTADFGGLLNFLFEPDSEIAGVGMDLLDGLLLKMSKDRLLWLGIYVF